MTDLPKEIADLLKTPPSADAETIEEQEIDISQFARLRKMKEDDTGKIPLEGQAIGRKIIDLFQKTCRLPNPDDYFTIAAYASLPSVLCDIIPILEFRGEPGSGKSDTLEVFAAVTDSQVVARSTAASIKRDINAIRFADPITCTRERNCFFLIDNSDKEFWEERDTLTAFLNGYNRVTDLQKIAGDKGSTISFHVFCPKVITTIHPPESSEVKRRLLTVHFRRFSDFKSMLSLQKVAYKTLARELKEFWAKPDNWEMFYDVRKDFIEYLESNDSKVPDAKWKLVRDLVVAGLCTGVFPSYESAAAFFETHLTVIDKTRDYIEGFLESLLSDLSGVASAQWKNCPKTIDLEVRPQDLQEAIDRSVKSGLIPRIGFEKLRNSLKQLGWGVVPKAGSHVYKFRR